MKRKTLAFLVSGFVVCVSCVSAQNSSSSEGASVQSDKLDANSEYEAGRNFLHGRGVGKDPVRALKHFETAAELGHIEAPGAIGYFYSTGLVVARDDRKAAEFFQRGADLGSASAKFNLGKFHIDRRGGLGGEDEGILLIEQAAGLGLPQANTTLAEIYFFGNDRIPVDYNKALRHAEAAAQAGVANAQTIVGVMKEHGYGTNVDLAGAEQWYRKAARQGECKAQSNLGHLLDPASEDSKRRIEAVAWLVIAASQGEPLATRTISEVEKHMAKKDFAQARDLADELQKEISGEKNR